MAFINNTPMIVGGGTPTPTTKKYKIGMKALSCTVTRSGPNLTITPEANTEFTNFHSWLYTYFSVPRPFVLMLSRGDKGNEFYGMNPSYPIGKFDNVSPIQLSFSSGLSYNATLNQTSQVVIANATVSANAIVVSNENIYLETAEVSTKGYTVTRKTLSKSGDDLHFALGIPVIEESEE